MPTWSRTLRSGTVAAVGLVLALTGCSSGTTATPEEPEADRADAATTPQPQQQPITLALAGDVHFEDVLSPRLDDPDGTLGPMSRELADADVAMVNLESAVAAPGATLASKELEDPAVRYWFQAPARALGLLGRSGVDVVSVANNHGADLGRTGLRASLAADGRAGVAVVGAGRGAGAAYEPHRVDVRGAEVAVLAADASPRESASPVWDAGEGGLGLATARGPGTRRLLDAVREAADRSGVVVVYLHWGEQGQVAPTERQQRLARRLAEAGADVVVGTHAHVLQGSGTLDGAYVAYGLGNFAWYNARRSVTGVLRLAVSPDGEVVSERWVPGRIPPGGGYPQRVEGAQATAAAVQWRRLGLRAGLEPVAGERPAPLPPYAAEVSRLSPELRERMRGSSHRAGCPVPLDRLRLVELSYVGFDDRPATGELVVATGVADDVVAIFRELYEARFPIRRMELVDEYGGDDDRSMAANNSSAYNCRFVAGTDRFSDHARGRAIDVNPVQNPYLTGGEVLPPAGSVFADVDRTPGAQPEPGAVRAGDVVVRAFTSRGWTWGGTWSEPDYQHFAAPDPG
ncbi:CapA family protein [Nocardioides aequoreus]|uniref:CapA family protein n=1 Tax=Nocardioides aequoreus TaxID=397278 RepID=UPI000692024F|nr:CapA family protein [Nocardioides aequoreus]